MPVDDGELRMAITRAAESQVPPEADSAVIRLWHPTAGTNLIVRVAIPNPGDTQRVTIKAPARDGYSVGVLAYHGIDQSFTGKRLALVGGRTDSVTVTTGEATSAHIELSRWDLAMTLPDSVVPGDPTIIGGRITGGPGFFGGASVCIVYEPWTTAGDLGRNCHYPSPQAVMVTADSFTATFTPPAIDADTTLWLGFDWWIDTQPWQTGGLDYVLLPSLMLGDTLYSVPAKVSGEITIVFGSDARDQ